MWLVPHKDGFQQVHIGRLIMDQIALQASLLSLLQSILVYPALLLAAILSKLLGCNYGPDLVAGMGILGAVYAFIEGDILVGLGVAVLGYFEVALVEIACIPPIVDANLLGMEPKVLARLMHLQ